MTYFGDGDSCCEPDSGSCCGPGSWCCNRAGKHDHDEDMVSPWDLLGIAPSWTGGMSTEDFVSEQRNRSGE